MFGDRLKQIRKSRGYTLESLAELYNKNFDAGLNKGTLSKYENNKQQPMVSVVNNLATLLNVQTDYLLCRDEERKKQTIEDLFNIEFDESSQKESNEQRYFAYAQKLRKLGVTDTQFDKILKIYEMMEEK